MSSAKLMWFRKSCSILDENFQFKYMLACPISLKTLKNWMYIALGSSKLHHEITTLIWDVKVNTVIFFLFIKNSINFYI